jgi:hypothetical protein
MASKVENSSVTDSLACAAFSVRKSMVFNGGEISIRNEKQVHINRLA